jgi:Rieske Fe-S protein
MSTLDRRRFVELTVGAAVSCAGLGCASMVTHRVVPDAGTLRLPLADHPQLAESGGFLRVQPVGYADPVYVLTVGVGAFVAVSPICTHRGCTVDVAGEALVCPCHGSTYDRNGDVLEGPAERSLQRFPTRIDGDGVLWIRLEP